MASAGFADDLVGGISDLKLRGTAERFFGTMFPVAAFSSERDCEALQAAMKGTGTDEKAIIDILSYRSSDQRLTLKADYKSLFDRDLIDDLESELSGDFRETIKALFLPPSQYDAWSLRQAVKNCGTDERCLIEILCTRTNTEIRAIAASYKEQFGRSLAEDVKHDTSSHFKRLLLLCIEGKRDELTSAEWELVVKEGPEIVADQKLARRDAEELVKGGVSQLGTNESVHIGILARRHYYQLRATFDEYQQLTGRDIVQDIKKEFKGDLEDALVALVESARNRPGYFAAELRRAMKGLGTDDSTLIRIVVSRSEIDLGNIKQQYKERYGKSLAEAIKADTSGDYRYLLTSIVGD